VLSPPGLPVIRGVLPFQMLQPVLDRLERAENRGPGLAWDVVAPGGFVGRPRRPPPAAPPPPHDAGPRPSGVAAVTQVTAAVQVGAGAGKRRAGRTDESTLGAWRALSGVGRKDVLLAGNGGDPTGLAQLRGTPQWVPGFLLPVTPRTCRIG
jgi:hypothetical protein